MKPGGCDFLPRQHPSKRTFPARIAAETRSSARQELSPTQGAGLSGAKERGNQDTQPLNRSPGSWSPNPNASSERSPGWAGR